MNLLEALKVLRKAAQWDLDRFTIELIDLNRNMEIAKACTVSYDARIKELENE